MGTEARPITYYTGAEILAYPLPELLTRPGYQTTSTAFHNRYYSGPLAPWPIESEARDIVSDKHLNTDHLSVHVQNVLIHPCFIEREHHLCGDEQSVCGRFVQNALSPVTAVAFANGIRARFGDFKASADASGNSEGTKGKTGKKGKKGERKIPDFVAIRCDALSIVQLKEAIYDTIGGGKIHDPASHPSNLGFSADQAVSVFRKWAVSRYTFI